MNKTTRSISLWTVAYLVCCILIAIASLVVINVFIVPGLIQMGAW